MSGVKFAKQTSPLSALTQHIFRFHRISCNSLQSLLGSVLTMGKINQGGENKNKNNQKLEVKTQKIEVSF
jgi:hypothetical protein